jgi:hypothetical protein
VHILCFTVSRTRINEKKKKIYILIYKRLSLSIYILIYKRLSLRFYEEKKILKIKYIYIPLGPWGWFGHPQTGAQGVANFLIFKLQ